MVLTRSGRGTTKAENDIKPQSPKKQRTPKKSISKSPKKSPKKSNTQNKGYQILVDLCLIKPTDKTFTGWSCLTALFILAITAYSVFDESDTIHPNACFLSLILVIHAFDISTNFCNELLGKGGHLTDVIFFTESAVNIGDVFLFLVMIHQTCNLFITAAVMITFNILALNIKYKNDDTTWVRLLSYIVLIACFAFNYQFVITNCRITTYFSLIFASMIFDAFDFPDKYFNAIPMCEGLIIFSRSLGVYMLITAQLLSTKEDHNTNFEGMMKSWIGI